MLYSIDEKKSFPVTDGMTPDSSPVSIRAASIFTSSPIGILYSRTQVISAESSYSNITGIYAVTLAADTPSPFAPESDEEKGPQQRTISSRPFHRSRWWRRAANRGTGGGTGGPCLLKPAEPQTSPAGEDAQKETPKKDEPKADKKPTK
jgi:hypothetical protein